ALLDVRGVAGADQGRAHLLAGGPQGAAGDAQGDGVQAHRSIRMVPDSSTSPLHPSGTASVASGSSTIAGPSMRSPASGSPVMTSVSPSTVSLRLRFAPAAARPTALGSICGPGVVAVAR